MQASDPLYTGRFAPTPSGPLHIGSILAALASYLDAKLNKGKWLVRIDDLDTPRIKPGTSDDILKALDKLGLHWDGEIVYQSNRINAYDKAFLKLADDHLLYRCICPRKTVKSMPYPGTCRGRSIPASRQHSVRIKTHNEPVGVLDRLQGKYFQSLEKNAGDFIIRRTDGYYAYHLATVVDDAWQNISHIVRGIDLLESTPRQVYLQRLLKITTPAYLHIPLAVDKKGVKISKSTGGLDALIQDKPARVLVRSLRLLGQVIDEKMTTATVEEILALAIMNWQISSIPPQKAITAG